MDLDLEEPFDCSEGHHQSNPSSNISDMDVDTSPSKYFQHQPESVKNYSCATGIFNQDPDNGSNNQESNNSTIATIKPKMKLTKTGYGIPEDDPIFSHFPGKVQARLSKDLVHRKHSKSAKPESSISGKHERLLSSSSRSEKSSCFQSCCNVIINIIKGMVACGMIYLVAAYIVNFQKEKCRLSRQFNSRALKTDLETLVFGQHIASEIIPSEMDLYFNRLIKKNPTPNKHGVDDVSKTVICKPLVLSFHGWTGVGKNFISKIISDSFPYSMVNHIVIPLHFPHEAKEYKYGQIIQDWLVSNNTDCLVNVVIMDEMDKAFSPVTEGIIAAIEALSQPCHLATPTIFLLLSNSYATDINRLFFQFATEDINRDEISLSQFRSLFSSEVENTWNSLLDRKGLIDAYVPFLPLEQRHVVQCIKRDLVSKRLSTDRESVGKVLEELNFKSVAGLHISTTGCKRVADKVDYVMLSL